MLGWFRWNKRPVDNRPPQGPNESFVNLDQASVPLNNPSDPTSLLFMLTLEAGGGVMLGWDPDIKAHVAAVEFYGDFEGRTQHEALEKAWEAVQRIKKANLN